MSKSQSVRRSASRESIPLSVRLTLWGAGRFLLEGVGMNKLLDKGNIGQAKRCLRDLLDIAGRAAEELATCTTIQEASAVLDFYATDIKGEGETLEELARDIFADSDEDLKS